jgi:hypothetical protein
MKLNWKCLGVAALLPVLAGCENNATGFVIDTSQHALILVREQPHFWSSEVKQSVIASRLPHCQRKVAIHPGTTEAVDMYVYEAGDRLWALFQGGRWYLASTEKCLVQDWTNSSGNPPGELVGRFKSSLSGVVFERAERASE